MHDEQSFFVKPQDRKPFWIRTAIFLIFLSIAIGGAHYFLTQTFITMETLRSGQARTFVHADGKLRCAVSENTDRKVRDYSEEQRGDTYSILFEINDGNHFYFDCAMYPGVCIRPLLACRSSPPIENVHVYLMMANWRNDAWPLTIDVAGTEVLSSDRSLEILNNFESQRTNFITYLLLGLWAFCVWAYFIFASPQKSN